MLTCQLQSKEHIMPSPTNKAQDNSIRENVYKHLLFLKWS